MGAAPTGGVRMRDDRGNNAGSHSLLSIPLCAILCCLREEQKEKGKVLMQNTGERHIPRRLRLSWSFKDRLLIELFTCKRQLVPSFSSFLAHPHASRAHIHTLCCYYTASFKPGANQNQAFGTNITAKLAVCLVSKAWRGTGRAVNLTLWPACTPSS